MEKKKIKRQRYHHVKEGEWIPTRRKNNFEQCCDCGLVHVVDYRINKFNQIEFKVRRHAQATGAARKYFNFEKEEL